MISTGPSVLLSKSCHIAIGITKDGDREIIGFMIQSGESEDDVNIETNGAVDIVDFLGKVPKSDNLFFTIDYKLPSSGMTDKMIWNNFINLRPCDVIKFVIGSDEDMNLTIDIVKKLKQVYTEMPHIYLGAVYGMYDAQKLVNIMLKEPVLCDATFQIQLHKVIWDPEERGV